MNVIGAAEQNIDKKSFPTTEKGKMVERSVHIWRDLEHVSRPDGLELRDGACDATPDILWAEIR